MASHIGRASTLPTCMPMNAIGSPLSNSFRQVSTGQRNLIPSRTRPTLSQFRNNCLVDNLYLCAEMKDDVPSERCCFTPNCFVWKSKGSHAELLRGV